MQNPLSEIADMFTNPPTRKYQQPHWRTGFWLMTLLAGLSLCTLGYTARRADDAMLANIEGWNEGYDQGFKLGQLLHTERCKCKCGSDKCRNCKGK